MTAIGPGGSSQAVGWRRIAPALGLFLLAPITAEYLAAYDDSTGNLGELIGGLYLFAPLYGGAAVLIREMARRTGRGWPTIFLLGLAFGVAQAGLIDHSLFNPSYRDVPGWDEMFQATYVPGLGISLNPLTFAAGHMIFSVAAPIALVEALVPGRSRSPWLGWFGLSLVAIGFVLAAGAVVSWSVETEGFVPAVGHLVGAASVVAVLVAAAFFVGAGRPQDSERRAASPWLVGATTFILLFLPIAVELLLERAGVDGSSFLIGFPALVVRVMLLTTLGALLVRWSSRTGWGQLHSLAAAGGALLTSTATAFAAQPIGNVGVTAKYLHNTIALLGVIALLTIATRRQRDAAHEPGQTAGTGAADSLDGRHA